MENQTISDKKLDRQNMKSALIVLAGFTLLFGGSWWFILQNQKNLAEANKKLLQEKNISNTCAYKKDSLTNEVNQISNYKALVKSMTHRDEATGLLKYKIGDFVYLKRDSDKVVVSDIVIGGAKFEYYVRYKVLHKDKTEEEVKPELIY